jgi:hypothetical protein
MRHDIPHGKYILNVLLIVDVMLVENIHVYIST